MSNTYIKRIDTAVAENPFAPELILEIKPGSKTVSYAGNGTMLNKETGESMGDMSVIGIRKRVDRTEFIKIYERGIQLAFDLKPAGLGVLRVLLEAYRQDKFSGEKIYFNHKVAVNDFEYSRTVKTFTNGINELLSKKFIAEMKDQKYWFWVNPSLFFKGDRLRIVNEYTQSKKDDMKEALENNGQQRLID
jgi:hypothetical protein